MDPAFDKKWKAAEDAVKEIEELEQSEETVEDLDRLSVLKEKLTRLIGLKDKIVESEEKVHLQNAILLRERNVYLEKWRMIEQLGQDNDWNDDTGLLNAIKELIENISKSPGDNK